MLAESKLKRWWCSHSLPQPPHWLSTLLTAYVLLSISGPLWFGPCEHDSDLAERMIGSVARAATSVASALPATTPASVAALVLG